MKETINILIEKSLIKEESKKQFLIQLIEYINEKDKTINNTIYKIINSTDSLITFTGIVLLILTNHEKLGNEFFKFYKSKYLIYKYKNDRNNTI